MRALFLDRDGVINIEKKDSYIFSPEEFIPYPGALDAIVKARNYFDLIIIVTNQRGIGRGLMTEVDLENIHQYLQALLKKKGGRIDNFYFAPYIDNDHPHRKPNTGMALQAQKDYPDIDFENSVMIGNNMSDMEFGKNMLMQTVFLHTTKPKQMLPNVIIDEQYDSLKSWADAL